MLRLTLRGLRRGCTGLELLAVTGILATLAGQGNGVFLQVQEKSHQAVCSQQLSQIHKLFLMYADDNEGKLPLAWFFVNGNDPRTIVNVLAGTNTDLRRLFLCPAAPDPWKQYGLTYVYNDTIRGRMLDSVPNPSTTWLMMDANMVSANFPPPHLGGYNVLFCDGHIKWVPREQLATFWKPPAVEQPASPPQPPAPPAGGDD